MPRIRLRRKAIFYLFVVITVLFVVSNLLRWSKSVSLETLTVNSSMKQFIQKLVHKRKRVLTFEIGRPKPEDKHSLCQFTQSDGLELLAENYLYPEDNAVESKCLNSGTVICAVSGSMPGSIRVSCEHNPCAQIVKVGSLMKASGEIQWEDVSSGKLENFIQEFVLKTLDEMHPFFYLKCGDITQDNIGSQPTQLISVPLAKQRGIADASRKEMINVNIVFLNSVSRRHFYRSLPKTIASFRSINLNPKSTSNVLDFEVYQALGITPQETLFKFITGKISNNSQSRKTLLSNFNQAGYQSLWQIDQCWKSDVDFAAFFGISNPKIQNNLESLKVKMKSENIDSLGLTHSSCVMNKRNTNNLKIQQMCFNGKFQHDFLLEYIGQSISEANNKDSSRPLFSLTSLSLGVEESGRHIQALDNSLASFVTKMAADKNTITILMSDHGNTFGIFPVQTMEGQYEQYNPFLFMVLPTFVAWRLGESKKKNLLNNQLKLISVFDVHNMALSLVGEQKYFNGSDDRHDGLFMAIESNRNCAQLPLSSTSLCICDGWDSKQKPNIFHYIIAEFALGQLNNLIASQYNNQKNQEKPFATCQRLNGKLLRNISQKRIENGYIITQIDIYIQNNEFFRVSVKWHGDNDPAMEMALVNYKRKHSDIEHISCSMYIDQDLCVCNLQSQDGNPAKISPNWRKYGSVFHHQTKAENRHSHCLYILSRDYGVSTVFEAANMCSNVEYIVRMNFELENMRTPGELPVNATVPPMSIKFLTFVMPMHLTNPGTWEYEVDFSLKVA